MKSLLKRLFQLAYPAIYGQKMLFRNDFLKLVSAQAGSFLEIGPFTNPFLRGPNVAYFDVLDRTGLLKRAQLVNYPIADVNAVPEIDFVSPIGDLSIIKRVFNTLFSSHCVEHQPDLIKHLQQVSALLTSEGRYFLIIPDKRYCHDALLPESSIASVLEAHHQNRKIHTMKSVIEHQALTTHNDARRHWLGDHGKLSETAKKAESAMNAFVKADGEYMDVHAWQFTPQSFSEIIHILNLTNYIDFVVEQIYPTPVATLEFYAVLKKRNKS